MTTTEAIAKFLRYMSDAYVIEQQAKGMYASGRSAKSLKEVTDPTGGKLFGKGYWLFQKTGRGPGKASPVDAIEQWIKDKGLTSDKGTVRDFAFAISRKHAKEGSDIYRGRRPGINVQDELLEARKELMKDVGQIKKNELLEKLKQAANIQR